MQREIAPPIAPSAGQDSNRAQVLAELQQRFVALPDPSAPTGWLVDLRDPFHPVVHRYETWAAADEAAIVMIAQCLREQVVDPLAGASLLMPEQTRIGEPIVS